ncbi:hypothetical protein BJ546DRAFT_595168 [Cryomyces antarcticus]
MACNIGIPTASDSHNDQETNQLLETQVARPIVKDHVRYRCDSAVEVPSSRRCSLPSSNPSSQLVQFLRTTEPPNREAQPSNLNRLQSRLRLFSVGSSPLLRSSSRSEGTVPWGSQTSKPLPKNVVRKQTRNGLSYLQICVDEVEPGKLEVRSESRVSGETSVYCTDMRHWSSSQSTVRANSSSGSGSTGGDATPPTHVGSPSSTLVLDKSGADFFDPWVLHSEEKHHEGLAANNSIDSATSKKRPARLALGGLIPEETCSNAHPKHPPVPSKSPRRNSRAESNSSIDVSLERTLEPTQSLTCIANDSGKALPSVPESHLPRRSKGRAASASVNHGLTERPRRCASLSLQQSSSAVHRSRSHHTEEPLKRRASSREMTVDAVAPLSLLPKGQGTTKQRNQASPRLFLDLSRHGSDSSSSSSSASSSTRRTGPGHITPPRSIFQAPNWGHPGSDPSSVDPLTTPALSHHPALSGRPAFTESEARLLALERNNRLLEAALKAMMMTSPAPYPSLGTESQAQGIASPSPLEIFMRQNYRSVTEHARQRARA